VYLFSPLTSQPMPPLPYTQSPPGARVAGGCKERCVRATTPLPAQLTAPRFRAWQVCLITQPPLLTPTPFVSSEQGLCQDLPACSACSSNANPLGRAAGASRPFMHTSQGLAPLHGGSIVENRLHAESTARRSARLASAAGSV